MQVDNYIPFNVARWQPIFYLVIFSVGFSAPAHSQHKYEVEHRIKANEAPSRAVRFVEGLNISGKKKWYHEHNLKSNSFEAKIKGHHKLSIEFDTLGIFQDLELTKKFKNIPIRNQGIIRSSLNGIFDLFKIKKLQIQYRDSDALKTVIHAREIDFSIPHRYEIVIQGKWENTVKLYEITLESNGDLVTSEIIIPTHSDILEY